MYCLEKNERWMNEIERLEKLKLIVFKNERKQQKLTIKNRFNELEKMIIYLSLCRPV